MSAANPEGLCGTPMPYKAGNPSVAVVAAIVAAGWVLSKFPWAQTKAFQESAIIVYLVTLTLRLIFSWPKVRNSEKPWVKKAAKAADAIHWIAAILYASVLFS